MTVTTNDRGQQNCRTKQTPNAQVLPTPWVAYGGCAVVRDGRGLRQRFVRGAAGHLLGRAGRDGPIGCCEGVLGVAVF